MTTSFFREFTLLYGIRPRGVEQKALFLISLLKTTRLKLTTICVRINLTQNLKHVFMAPSTPLFSSISLPLSFPLSQMGKCCQHQEIIRCLSFLEQTQATTKHTFSLRPPPHWNVGKNEQ